MYTNMAYIRWFWMVKVGHFAHNHIFSKAFKKPFNGWAQRLGEKRNTSTVHCGSVSLRLSNSRDSRGFGGRGVSDALRTRAPQLAWLAARLCATPALRDIDDIEIY